MRKVRKGLKARVMEDKWKGEWMESGLLIRRSWTGMPIYWVPIKSVPGGGGACQYFLVSIAPSALFAALILFFFHRRLVKHLLDRIVGANLTPDEDSAGA